MLPLQYCAEVQSPSLLQATQPLLSDLHFDVLPLQVTQFGPQCVASLQAVQLPLHHWPVPGVQAAPPPHLQLLLPQLSA